VIVGVGGIGECALLDTGQRSRGGGGGGGGGGKVLCFLFQGALSPAPKHESKGN